MTRHQINYKKAEGFFKLLLFITFPFYPYAKDKDPEQDKAKFTRFKNISGICWLKPKIP